MNKLFTNINFIGDLFVDEIFYFYDEPLLFSCITNSFKKYIVSLINIDEWLCVSISEQLLARLKNNKVTLRSLFVNPEDGFVLKISLINNKNQIEIIDPTKINDEDLPNDGEYLDYIDRVNKLLPVINDDITEVSYNERRDILDIALKNNTNNEKEIECSILSHILENFQQLIYSIANKNRSKKLLNFIKQNFSIQFTGVFASSFGIRLKSDAFSLLNNQTVLTPVINELFILLNVSNKEEELHKFLCNNNHITLRYREFLRYLVSTNYNIIFSGASPNKNVYSYNYSTIDMEKNLKLIDKEIDTTTKINEYYGSLVGINTNKKTFEFINNNKKEIKGHFAKGLYNLIFAVPQDCKVSIEEKLDFNELTGEEKYFYTLLDLDAESIN